MQVGALIALLRGVTAYVALEMKAQFNTIIRQHSTERDDYKNLEEARKALADDGITIDHFLPHLKALDPEKK